MREIALREALDGVRARCDVASRRAADPVAFVHRYRDPLEQELVGLVAASLAFGNVKALTAKIDDALGRLGPDLLGVAASRRETARRLRGWKHRVYTAGDLTCLVIGARRVQLEHGTLGARFAAALAEHGTLRDALGDLVGDVRRAGGFARARTVGAAHLLPDPRAGSAAKRLMLFLRWMVRPADGVDLGLWSSVSPALLLVPVDVHVHRLGYNLGLTSRRTADWRTAEEITAGLARWDRADPVKYDFALCHLGMLQHCPSRADPVRCEGCGIRDVCRHWRPE